MKKTQNVRSFQLVDDVQKKITNFDKNKNKTTKQQTNKQKQSKTQNNTNDICTNVSFVVHPYTINTIVVCERSTPDMCSILK